MSWRVSIYLLWSLSILYFYILNQVLLYFLTGSIICWFSKKIRCNQIIYPLEITQVNLLNFSKNMHLIFFNFVVTKKNLIFKFNHDIMNYGYISESTMFMSFVFFVLSNIVVSINFVKVFFELDSFLIYVPPKGRFRKHRRKANRRFAFFHLHKQIFDLLLSSDSWIFLRSHKD